MKTEKEETNKREHTEFKNNLRKEKEKENRNRI